jgi:hypothetical protein
MERNFTELNCTLYMLSAHHFAGSHKDNLGEISGVSSTVSINWNETSNEVRTTFVSKNN